MPYPRTTDFDQSRPMSVETVDVSLVIERPLCTTPRHYFKHVQRCTANFVGGELRGLSFPAGALADPQEVVDAMAEGLVGPGLYSTEWMQVLLGAGMSPYLRGEEGRLFPLDPRGLRVRVGRAGYVLLGGQDFVQVIRELDPDEVAWMTRSMVEILRLENKDGR